MFGAASAVDNGDAYSGSHNLERLPPCLDVRAVQSPGLAFVERLNQGSPAVFRVRDSRAETFVVAVNETAMTAASTTPSATTVPVAIGSGSSPASVRPNRS